MADDPHDIVIVGGGAGGLELATRLGRRLGRTQGPRRVLLIDRAIFHLWKPSLHEVAAGSLDSHQEGLSYPLLARRNHFTFALGDMTGLDVEGRVLTLAPLRADDGQVLVETRAVPFETLVLALGSGSNLFDTPGAAEHVHLLEDVADAEAFNRRLTSAFLATAYSGDRDLRIVIVGAGATGVELATELIEGHDELNAGLRPQHNFALHVTVIEAASRILGGLPQPVADKAAEALRDKGIRLLTDAKVAAVHADRVETSQGDVPADLTVWAAGILADGRQRKWPVEVGKLNQFVVDDRLRTSAPNIWAMGDCAQALGPDGKALPARAQVASQQAAWLARALLDADRLQKPFVYGDRGSLISLGNDQGVGSLMGGLGGPKFRIEGLLARLAYMSLHLDHHRTVIGVWRTATLAIARLLHRRVTGRLKLH